LKPDVGLKFIRLAKRMLANRPIICDVGSRDAQEGIFLMKQLGGKELHVFEPNPNAARVCRENLATFTSESHANIAVFNEVAVTDRAGELRFYPVNASLSENKDSGFSSLFQINPDYTKTRGSIVQDEVVIEATILDEYFTAREQPDLLWIDVEGAELQVLRGAARVLRGVTLLHIEVSFRPMQIGKPLFWEISTHLENHGFAFHSFMEVSAFKGFLYRHRLLPNLPWRLNAVFYRPGIATPAGARESVLDSAPRQ
jgi:FkbM family methyltransferase